MAKQTGVTRLQGTIGNITYKKVNGKDIACKKSSLTKEQVLKNAAFANSRLAMDDFGTASYGSRLLREAFYTTGRRMGNRNQYASLTGFLRKLLATDTLHEKGQKRLSACNLDEIRHYRWNKKSGMSSLLYVQPVMVADTEAGTLTATIPALCPAQEINKHQAATHYRLTFNGAAIDFDGLRFSKGLKSTGWLSVNEDQPEQVLELRLKDAAGRFLFGGLMIEFGQETNGKVYDLWQQTTLGFTMAYLGQVPAIVEEPIAMTTVIAGEAAVQEALVIIDWKEHSSPKKTLQAAPERRPAPKKPVLNRLRDTGQSRAERKGRKGMRSL